MGQNPLVPFNPEMYIADDNYRRLYSGPESEYVKDYKIGTAGAVGLLATLGVIVAIGVIGTKRGVKWID